MKRLLRQKRVSALQIGRIMFLNNCILSENSNNEQLFTVEEMDQLLHNFYQYCSEEEYKEFKLYQHLVTFSLNVLNLLLAKNATANQSAAFLISQAKAARYLMKDYAVKFENKVNEKEGYSFNELSCQENLSRSTLTYLLKLIDKYGAKILDQPNKKYSKEFKEAAIARVLKHQESGIQISLELGLRSRGMLVNWVRMVSIVRPIN